MIIAPITQPIHDDQHQPQIDRINGLAHHIINQTLLNPDPAISKEEKITDVLGVIRNMLDNFLLHNTDKQRAKAVIEQLTNDVFHQYQLSEKRNILNQQSK